MRKAKRLGLAVTLAGLTLSAVSPLIASAAMVDGVINLSGDAQEVGSKDVVMIDFAAESGAVHSEKIYEVSGDYQNMTFSINADGLVDQLNNPVSGDYQNFTYSINEDGRGAELNAPVSTFYINGVSFLEEGQDGRTLYYIDNDEEIMSMIESRENNYRFFNGIQLNPSKTYCIAVDISGVMSGGRLFGGSTMTLFRVSDGNGTEIKNESGWKLDSTGWWYLNSDGSYPTNSWVEIDGKWYYFNEAGYMLENTTTPDGYIVGSDGAWVK